MEDFDIIEFVANKHGCEFSSEDDYYALLEGWSSAGRNWCLELNAEDLINSMKENVEGYDVDYETYIWLDDFGHGGRGAPLSLREVLEDSEEIKQELETMYEEVSMIKECVGEYITKNVKE